MGYRISKVYTGTGDAGTTGMADGQRLAKSHPRIETIGELDMLNSQLGLLLAQLQLQGLTDIFDSLAPYQHLLFDLGGELAMPEYQVLQATHIQQLETLIDRWAEQLSPLKDFILPGGSVLIAQAHICRCAARTAERRCQLLHEHEPLRAEVLGFINRLSDVFFVAARMIALHEASHEVLWQAQPAPVVSNE